MTSFLMASDGWQEEQFGEEGRLTFNQNVGNDGEWMSVIAR